MPDVFLHLQETLTSQRENHDLTATLTVLYLIPGNPGLIEYYFPFLNFLVEQSKTWDHVHGEVVVVAGASLGGFEQPPSTTSTEPSVSSPMINKFTKSYVEDITAPDLLPLYPSSFVREHGQGTYYTLKDQIKLTYSRINTLVERLSEILDQRRQPTNTNDDNAPSRQHRNIRLILAGHSVGAYIALEVIRLHHQTITSRTNTEQLPLYMLQSTLLLTPTISQISRSPSGRVATPLLTYLPFLPTLLQLGATSLTRYSPLPRSWIRALVKGVTGMKDGRMVDVTVRFLGENGGAVRQALEMAGEEMRVIGVTKWDEVVWGSVKAVTRTTDDAAAAAAGEGNDELTTKITEEPPTNIPANPTWTPPTHYFLFAKEDHWVANETRDLILQQLQGRAKILVDGERQMNVGLVHAWCLEQSEVVADVVGGWIKEILRGC